MKSRYILSILLFAFTTGIFSQIPTKGLVLYLPLNGNARDSSSLSNNGTAVYTTTTTDRFGKSGKAMSFNGNSSYIRIPASKSLNLANNKTISCWIYMPANVTINNYSTILYKDEPVNGTTYAIQLTEEGGYGLNRYKYCFFFTSSVTNSVVFSKQQYLTIKDQWVHLTGTYDSISGYSKIYYNGIVSDSIYLGNKSSNQSNLDLFIGCGKNNSYFGQTFFNGSLDDIRIYNRALSPKEVLALFNEGKPVSSQDTTTYYVASPEFKKESSVSHLIKSDLLMSKVTGVDSIANHYARFEYKENIKSVSVTDTLIIRLIILQISPALTTENTVKLYANSTKDRIFIDFGDFSKMQGYFIMIRDISDKLVCLTAASQKLVQIDLKLWSGKGTYVIQILDSQSKLVDTRKIILQ